MNKSSAKRAIRSRKGMTGMMEIAASALFLVVLALLALDICMAIFGASMNDRACHDAARAAAAANTSAKAWNLAQTALKAYSADGVFVIAPQLLSGTGQYAYQDFNGTPPPDTSPFVTVTTLTVVRIPAPIFFYGASFMKDGKAQFVQRYTYPIIKSQLLKT